MVPQMRSPEGSITNVTVTDIGDEDIALGLNHPLAGKDLFFRDKTYAGIAA